MEKKQETVLNRTFEAELPANYHAVKTVDAKQKKFTVVMNLVATLIAIVTVAIAALLVRPKDFYGQYSLLRNLLFLVAMVAYIVLHELVHGAAYKLLTKQKLTFGLTLSVAYCGVPHIYVYRKTALIALLAPFCVFLPIFLATAVFLPNEWDQVYAAFLLGLHIGGCCGDLYDAYLYLFRFRSPYTLMQDTGPKQTFYLPSETGKETL